MANRLVLLATVAAIAVLVFAVATYYFGYSSSPPPSQPQSPTAQADLNWAGYTAAYSFSNPKPLVTEVSGSWIVPQVQPSQNDTFSAVWVGIGGFFGHTLIQTGTEQDCINGVVSYSAWYELLPSDSVTITSMDVSPGDSITASIALTSELANLWSISISDLTTGQSFKREFFYDSSKLSAEWIVERPDVNNALSELADFGTVTISNCTATIGGEATVLGNLPSVRLFMVDMNGTRLAEPSGFSSGKAGFRATFLNSQ